MFTFLYTSSFAQQKKKIGLYELDIIKGLFFQPNTVAPYSGLAFENHPNDKKKIEVPIKDGKIHGVVKEWERNNKKIYEVEYNMGVKSGIESQWYASGQKKLEIPYNDGIPHGVCTEWHKKGTKKSEGYFNMGVEEGEHYWWYPSGRKDQFINYKNGKAEDNLKNWYDSNQLKLDASYKAGMLEGKKLEWYSSGQKKSEAVFKDSLQIGESLSWAKDGRIIGKKIYDNGQIVEEYNYASASLKTSNGYVQVYNLLRSNFLVRIKGQETEEYVDLAEDLTYTVDGMLLQLFTTATNKLDINEDASNDEALKSYIQFEKGFIEKNTSSEIQISQESGSNSSGLAYIHWHFVSPASKTTVEEQKARTVQYEHYISFICNDQIFSIYSVVTNSDDAVLVEKMIKEIASSVVLTKEPINLYDYWN